MDSGRRLVVWASYCALPFPSLRCAVPLSLSTHVATTPQLRLLRLSFDGQELRRRLRLRLIARRNLHLQERSLPVRQGHHGESDVQIQQQANNRKRPLRATVGYCNDFFQLQVFRRRVPVCMARLAKRSSAATHLLCGC